VPCALPHSQGSPREVPVTARVDWGMLSHPTFVALVAHRSGDVDMDLLSLVVGAVCLSLAWVDEV
jgi:hypothetical protein